MLRLSVLLNVEAGAAGQYGREEIAGELASAFERRGISAELIFLESGELDGAARRTALRVNNKEIDAIAAGGGDGTISTIAGVLAGTGIRLGLLPLGTLNHFAKDLAIPMDIDGAVGVIAGGIARPVDVGEINGEIFINNSSIGIYPYMVSDRERRRSEDGWSKWSAMALAAIRMLRRFPVRRLTVSADGWKESCHAPCIFVGNNVYQFGPTALGTRERLDAGELCLFIAKPRSRASLVRLAIWSALGRLNTAKDFEAFSVRSARIEARTSRLPVARDGEVETMVPPLQYAIRPGALHVFVPA